MTDDNSRIFKIGRSETTIVGSDRRIQIRMSSGKIYGPYSRVELLKFIVEGRLKGDESVLVEGESAWRPLSSDTEFFDALQEALLGVPAPKKKDLPSAPAVVASRPADESEDERTQIVAAKNALTPKLPSAPAPSPSAPASRPEVAPRTSAPSGSTRPPVPTSLASPPEAMPSPPAPRTEASSGRPKWVLPLAVVAALGGGLYFVGQKNSAPDNRPAGPLTLGASKLAYFRSIEALVAGQSFAIPALPAQLEGVPGWPLPEGEGAHVWLADFREAVAETDPKILGLASHWGRLAWDALWLSACLEPVSPGLSANLLRDSRVIFDELVTRGLVPAQMLALFKGARDMIEGRFEEAVPSLAAAGESPLAKALADEAAWFAWVAQDGKGAFRSIVAGSELDSLVLDLGAKARAALSAKPAEVGNWLVQLAYEDPRSLQLWLVSALANVRANRVQNAQRFYLAGLSSLSLYPHSFQTLYWKNYESFLNNFARQETASRARDNRRMLEEKSIDPKAWWDFEAEGLSTSSILQEILARSEKGVLNASDLAVLEVLGQVVPNGATALLTTAEHWALDGNFTKAREVFGSVAKLEPANVRAQGGLVWANAKLYRFDEALDALDRVVQARASVPEDLKFSGVLHSIARDPDKATQDFQAYLKQAPQDAWGHFFLARHWLEQGKNVDCLRSATLAFNHGAGELKQRAQLLLFHCSILAGIDAKKSIGDLKALTDADPAAIHLRLAYADALVAMDLLTDAVSYVRDSIAVFPKSYELRLKLGDLYAKQGNYDSAVAFYSRAGRDRPRAAEGRVKIAKIFEEQKRYLEAGQSFEAAGRVEPGYPEIWLLAARAYDKAGRVQEAAAMYRREIEARPAVIASFIEASEFLLKINAPQEVPKLFQSFSSDFHGDPRVMTRLSQAYLALRDFANARSFAASAIKASPKTAEPYYVLGAVFEQESQFAESKKYYETYLELLPGAPDSAVLRRKIGSPPFNVE